MATFTSLRYISVVGVLICLFNLVIAEKIAQIVGASMIVLGVVVYYVAHWLKKKYITR